MKSIVLVGCTKTKRPGLLPAFLKYQASPWFTAMWDLGLKLATDPNKDIYILSAKHGLLHPLEQIEDYEQALPTSQKDRLPWATRIYVDLLARVPRTEAVTFNLLCGQRYREPLGGLLRLTAGAAWETFAPFANTPGIQAQIVEAGKLANSIDQIDHFLDTVPMAVYRRAIMADWVGGDNPWASGTSY